MEFEAQADLELRVRWAQLALGACVGTKQILCCLLSMKVKAALSQPLPLVSHLCLCLLALGGCIPQILEVSPHTWASGGTPWQDWVGWQGLPLGQSVCGFFLPSNEEDPSCE